MLAMGSHAVNNAAAKMANNHPRQVDSNWLIRSLLLI